VYGLDNGTHIGILRRSGAARESTANWQQSGGRGSRRDEQDFHCAGDTGAIQDPNPQLAVASAMERHLTTDVAPLFFYHLGDVVYSNGERVNYFPQFYEPYASYTVPILAIPGNHDGDVAPGFGDRSLASSVDNFCATA
jgi:hypothetical protein